MRAVAEAMFAGAPLSATKLDEHVEAVDEFISAASRALRFGMRMLLLLVRFAPVLLFFRARTLERLPVLDRVEVLARLERSQLLALSLAFVGWRTVMTILFYEDARELAAIGYSEQRKVRTLPLAVPVPIESGVRLGDGHAHDDDDETGSPREVA